MVFGGGVTLFGSWGALFGWMYSEIGGGLWWWVVLVVWLRVRDGPKGWLGTTATPKVLEPQFYSSVNY